MPRVLIIVLHRIDKVEEEELLFFGVKLQTVQWLITP